MPRMPQPPPPPTVWTIYKLAAKQTRVGESRLPLKPRLSRSRSRVESIRGEADGSAAHARAHSGSVYWREAGAPVCDPSGALPVTRSGGPTSLQVSWMPLSGTQHYRLVYGSIRRACHRSLRLRQAGSGFRVGDDQRLEEAFAGVERERYLRPGLGRYCGLQAMSPCPMPIRFTSIATS
jgi:hypothetical protein